MPKLDKEGVLFIISLDEFMTENSIVYREMFESLDRERVRLLYDVAIGSITVSLADESFLKTALMLSNEKPTCLIGTYIQSTSDQMGLSFIELTYLYGLAKYLTTIVANRLSITLDNYTDYQHIVTPSVHYYGESDVLRFRVRHF